MVVSQADTRLYHGGAPGRKPGDLLLPPAETGYRTVEQRWREELGADVRPWMEPDRNRADRVYLTARRDLAEAYAMCHELTRGGGGPGVLYLAEPVGELEDDPDLPGLSFQCASARVLRIYDPCVTMPFARFERIMLSVVRLFRSQSGHGFQHLIRRSPVIPGNPVTCGNGLVLCA